MKRSADKVLDVRAKALERHLTGQRDPVSAYGIGATIGLTGPREHVRRMVREVVTHARQHLGMRICGGNDGLWLARNGQEWRDYLASVAAKTRFGFVRIRRAKQAVTDRMSGQGRLFGLNGRGSKYGPLPDSRGTEKRCEWATA